MDNIERTIIKFVNEIYLKYGSYINMRYDYNVNEDFYYIWHNNYNLEYNDDKFSAFIGEKLCRSFFDEGIFNISFGYDYIRAKEYKKTYCITNIAEDNFSHEAIYIDIITSDNNFNIEETSTQLTYPRVDICDTSEKFTNTYIVPETCNGQSVYVGEVKYLQAA
jgi:hypothetical protein